MSVHSNYYENEDEYELDLQYEYRKGNEEDEILFYGCPSDKDIESEGYENESDII